MLRRHSRAGWLALIVTAACGGQQLGEIPEPQNVTANVSVQIPTVVELSWTTNGLARGYVEYGATPELGSVTPLPEVESQAHSATLLGLAPGTQYFFRVITWDGSAGVSAVSSVQTGALPVAGLSPSVQGAGATHFTLLPSGSNVVVFGPGGAIVWRFADAQGRAISRARFAHDGSGVLYSVAMNPPAAGSEIVFVPWNGLGPIATPIYNLVGDFDLLADGTLAALVSETRDGVVGDAIVEVRGGVPSTVWSSWSCFDPATDVGDAIIPGWSGANALDYEPPPQDTYVVGLKNLSSIAKVNRQGSCDWVLGQSGATLSFAAEATPFAHQSGFRLLGDRITVFDDEGAGTPRVVEYLINPAESTATQNWQYLAPAGVVGAAGGEPMGVSASQIAVNWGQAGQVELITQSGSQGWLLSAGAATGFGEVALDLNAL